MDHELMDRTMRLSDELREKTELLAKTCAKLDEAERIVKELTDELNAQTETTKRMFSFISDVRAKLGLPETSTFKDIWSAIFKAS